MQRIQLHPKVLDKPRTVCTDATCVEYKDDGHGTSTVVTNYITHCHAICYLSDIRPDSVAHAGLRACAAFSGGEKCVKSSCGHRWDQHMHVMYELEEKMATVTDSEIEKQLRTNASETTLKQTAIKELRNIGMEYKAEHEMIQQAAAQFGMFLQKNSLSPINNGTIAYIDSLIAAEKDKIDVGGNKIKLIALEADRAEYLETIAILERNLKSRNSTYKPLDETGVSQVVKQLYSLKHFGKNLQTVKNVTAQAHQATYREKPHRLPRDPNNRNLLKKSWPQAPTHQPGSEPQRYPSSQPSQSNMVARQGGQSYTPLTSLPYNPTKSGLGLGKWFSGR